MGGTRAAAAAAAWACALVCAVAQPAPAPSPAVFLTEQAALQAATEALSALSPPTLNCAVVGVLQGLGSSPNSLGDSFASVRATSTTLQAAVVNASRGSVVPADAGDLEGAGVWMLQYIAAVTGINVTFGIPKFPGSLYGSSAPPNARELYALNTLGFDCVANEVSILATRVDSFRFTIPVQQFSFQVIGPRPYLPSESLASKLWLWTKPFSPGLWGVLTASVVCTATVMFILESDVSHSLRSAGASTMSRVGHSIYLSAVGAALKEMYEPASAAGRVYMGVKSFMILVLMSAYIASLSAFLTLGPQPVQDITGIDDFQRTGIPACVRNQTAHLAFMQLLYPAIQVEPVAGLTTDVMNAILNNSVACSAGVVVDTEALYAMNSEQDPNGTYCNLELLQGPLSVGFFGLAFTPSRSHVSDAAFSAINTVIANAFDSNNYTAGPGSTVFQRDRPLCTAQAAEEAALAVPTAPQLQIVDAGVWAVEAIGLGLALLMWGANRAERRLRQRGTCGLSALSGAPYVLRAGRAHEGGEKGGGSPAQPGYGKHGAEEEEEEEEEETRGGAVKHKVPHSKGQILSKEIAATIRFDGTHAGAVDALMERIERLQSAYASETAELHAMVRDLLSQRPAGEAAA